MNRNLKIIIGLFFLIGSVVFTLKGEFVYAPVFVLVGGFYIYKGVR